MQHYLTGSLHYGTGQSRANGGHETRLRTLNQSNHVTKNSRWRPGASGVACRGLLQEEALLMDTIHTGH